MERFGLVDLPMQAKVAHNTPPAAVRWPLLSCLRKGSQYWGWKVPDERLDRLAAMSLSKNTIHASVK